MSSSDIFAFIITSNLFFHLSTQFSSNRIYNTANLQLLQSLSAVHCCGIFYNCQQSIVVVHFTTVSSPLLWYILQLSAVHCCGIFYNCQQSIVVVYFTIVSSPLLWYILQLSAVHCCGISSPVHIQFNIFPPCSTSYIGTPPGPGPLYPSVC
jgi:hypothetical protein